MEISKNCIDLVKSFEGFYPKEYVCPAGVLTQGYGSTGKWLKLGKEKYGAVWTEEQASELLGLTLNEFAKGVLVIIRGRRAPQMNQNQFDATVSFAYNIGLGALGNSTFFRQWAYGGGNASAKAMRLFNKGGGRVLKGLVRRREAEIKLFSQPPSKLS